MGVSGFGTDDQMVPARGFLLVKLTWNFDFLLPDALDQQAQRHNLNNTRCILVLRLLLSSMIFLTGGEPLDFSLVIIAPTKG